MTSTTVPDRIREALSTAALALLLALGACGGAAATATPTSLSITVYPKGIGAPGAYHRSLRCNPAGGSVPDPKRACRTLTHLAEPFAPVAPETNCTTLAMGPQQARVTGRLHGKKVSARFSLRGGCEIDRWRRVRTVVPGFAG